MARPEWLRTFVAVYRAGSITDAARLRSLSQPAVSQQVAGLERAVGTSLFVRTPSGVVPTERGRALYVEVAGALDQLEAVLVGLDAGHVAPAGAPLRLGASAEYFAAELVPRLARLELGVVTQFATDEQLLEHLEHGELDAAVTSSAPARRSISALRIGEKRFVLVGPPGALARPELGSLEAVASWLAERPWVAYSRELPVTRRFWQVHLGRPFPSHRLRLVAPDLRVVAAAVAEGMGCSLLPSFVCADQLAAGRIVEVYPVEGLLPPEPWFVCLRDGEATRPDVARLLAALDPSRGEG
jgi:DNA-binding transcriptional LysR family regulator